MEGLIFEILRYVRRSRDHKSATGFSCSKEPLCFQYANENTLYKSIVL